VNFVVGQRVRAKSNIYQPADDHSPGLLLARARDVLVVRALGVATFAAYVSHENVTDSSFGVLAEEVEAIENDPANSGN